MSTITIVMLGVPVANARHRMTKSGHAYTPVKTADERTRLKLIAQREMMACHLTPFEGPVSVKHRIERPIPTAFSKRKRQSALLGSLLPITRPDFDNYAKMVDALKGIVWIDDSQVCLYRLEKLYSDQPKVVFQISEI
jgi:Holliday junction resolvase RusA-like endonuclease